MKKLYTSKKFLKMAGGRMYTPYPTPLAINYRNHQKSQAYFSHLAVGTICFVLFYRKAKTKVKRGGMSKVILINIKVILIKTCDKQRTFWILLWFSSRAAINSLTK